MQTWIKGFKTRQSLIRKECIKTPKLEEDFSGSEKELREYCIKLVSSGSSDVKDVFALTPSKNVKLNVVTGNTTSVFTKIYFGRTTQVEKIVSKLNASGIANSYIPMFRVYEDNSSGIKLSMGTVNATEEYLRSWGILDSIKDLVAYMYSLVPKGVLIDSIYLPKDIICNPILLEHHALYIRSFNKGLVDCCFLRSNFKGFIQDRDFIRL